MFNLHSQVCGVVLRRSSSTARTLLENTVLLLALAGFGVLIVAHVGFVHHPSHHSHFVSPASSSHHHQYPYHNQQQHQQHRTPISPTQRGRYPYYSSSATTSIPLNCLPSVPNFQSLDIDVTHIVLLEPNTPSFAIKLVPADAATANTATTTNPLSAAGKNQEIHDENSFCTNPSGSNDETDNDYHNQKACTSLPPTHTAPTATTTVSPKDSLLEIDVDRNISHQEQLSLLLSRPIQFSHSHTKGFLLLPERERRKHNVVTQYVGVSLTDTNCFGEPFLQRIVQLVGTDTVLMNWMVRLPSQPGYLYHPKSQTLIELPSSVNTTTHHHSHNNNTTNVLIWKCGVVLTSIFLFFITTTLTSFTLHETQQRMLEFTIQLQRHVREERYLGKLIFLHLMENLVFCPIMVGMMFFLIEFYRGDKVLAFLVLSWVWIVEVFSVVSLRSWQGMQFFPKIFFLLFLLFHVYLFSCPLGFTYFALATTVMLWIHSVMFFWNRYELPAMAHGLVTQERPRMVGPSYIQPTTNNATATTNNHSIPSTTTTTTVTTSSNSPGPVMPVLESHQRPNGNTNTTFANSTTTTTPQVFLAPRSSNNNNSSNMNPSSSNNNNNGSTNNIHGYGLVGGYPSMSSIRASSDGNLSRPSSFLFHHDDEESSYMMLLNGEVVMHRPRSPNTTTSSNSSSNNNNCDVPQRITVPSPQPPPPSSSSFTTLPTVSSQEPSTLANAQETPDSNTTATTLPTLDLTPRAGSQSNNTMTTTTTNNSSNNNNNNNNNTWSRQEQEARAAIPVLFPFETFRRSGSTQSCSTAS